MKHYPKLIDDLPSGMRKAALYLEGIRSPKPAFRFPPPPSKLRPTLKAVLRAAGYVMGFVLTSLFWFLLLVAFFS